jgi:hypothetical protein
LRGSDDPTVVSWAAEHGRVVVTQDVSTMSRHAYARVAAGLPMPGVWEVPRSLPIGAAIDEILLLTECSVPGEWEGRVIRLLI